MSVYGHTHKCVCTRKHMRVCVRDSSLLGNYLFLGIKIYHSKISLILG